MGRSLSKSLPPSSVLLWYVVCSLVLPAPVPLRACAPAAFPPLTGAVGIRSSGWYHFSCLLAMTQRLISQMGFSFFSVGWTIAPGCSQQSVLCRTSLVCSCLLRQCPFGPVLWQPLPQLRVLFFQACASIGHSAFAQTPCASAPYGPCTGSRCPRVQYFGS